MTRVSVGVGVVKCIIRIGVGFRVGLRFRFRVGVGVRVRDLGLEERKNPVNPYPIQRQTGCSVLPPIRPPPSP